MCQPNRNSRYLQRTTYVSCSLKELHKNQLHILKAHNSFLWKFHTDIPDTLHANFTKNVWLISASVTTTNYAKRERKIKRRARTFSTKPII